MLLDIMQDAYHLATLIQRRQPKRAKQMKWGISEHSAVGNYHDRSLLGVGSGDFCEFSTSLLMKYGSALVPAGIVESEERRISYLPRSSLQYLRQRQPVPSTQA